VLSFLCDAAVWPQDPVSAARLHPLAAEYAGLNLMGGEFPAAAEVLCLVGSGYSNRRIAEQLVITENTAANHVRNILTMTGAANRTRAAMYAATHGLLQQRPVSGGSRPSAGHGVQ